MLVLDYFQRFSSEWIWQHGSFSYSEAQNHPRSLLHEFSKCKRFRASSQSLIFNFIIQFFKVFLLGSNTSACNSSKPYVSMFLMYSTYSLKYFHWILSNNSVSWSMKTALNSALSPSAFSTLSYIFFLLYI